jgi:SAM-dependent methyltransferase
VTDPPTACSRPRGPTSFGRVPQAAPYSALAGSYDRLVGAALDPVIRQSFERALGTYGVTFRSAADIGCGTGAFLDYLLRYRVPLWGVDASPAMLRVAARRLPAGRVRLLRQDMRRFALPRQVDLIVCNGDTLNYLLTPEDLVRTLERCGANLRSGGHLAADLLVGAPNSATGRQGLAVRSPGCVSLWRARVDPDRRLTRVDIRYGREGPQGWRWAQETHLQRWHTLSDLRAALRGAGFGPHAFWRLDSGTRPADSGWIKLLARKTDADSRKRRQTCQYPRPAGGRTLETSETAGGPDRLSH